MPELNPTLAALKPQEHSADLLGDDFADVLDAQPSGPGDPHASQTRPFQPAQAAKPASQELRTLDVDADELAELLAERRSIRAVQSFMTKHPDYFATPANGQQFERFLEENGLDWSLENLEFAFGQLKNLLEPFPEGSHPPRPVQRPTTPARPVRTGLPDHGDHPNPNLSPESEQRELERQIHDLPLDQARELMTRKMRELRFAQGGPEIEHERELLRLRQAYQP